jgi:hypothetical protein
VFLPIVYRWLEDVSNGYAGNYATGAKWDPIGCGASSSQLEKLNRIFQEAGLAEGSLLPEGQPIDVDYARINDLITIWSHSLAILHSRYAKNFECDLAIVTGKPSELPPVKEQLLNTLPFETERIIFAKNYDAGDWFPGALGGKIPDAKLVTVVGAALYNAIKNGLVPNWRIHEKIAQEVRNCWGILRKPGDRFKDSDIVLLPEEEEADVVLPTNSSIARARFIENEPEPVYMLCWRGQSPSTSAPSTEIKVRVKRVPYDRDGQPLRNEQLEIVRVYPAESSDRPINESEIELRLHPLPFDEVHWLDQGKFNVRWD